MKKLKLYDEDDPSYQPSYESADKLSDADEDDVPSNHFRHYSIDGVRIIYEHYQNNGDEDDEAD